MTKVLLTHAYSAHNRGDGLLVDLAIDAIKEALGSDVEINILAIDPKSFGEMRGLVQYPPASAESMRKIVGTWRMIKSVFHSTSATFLLKEFGERDPDIIIGVGGGYLRTDGGLQSFKSLIAHGLQLKWATKTGIPTIYLPQSVGPLKGLSGAIIKNACSKLDCLMVRDDRSLALVERFKNVSRCPDMAILSIAEGINSVDTCDTSTSPRLIARALKRSGRAQDEYHQRLQELMRSIPDLQLALQSAGRGNDDPSFYAKMGWRQESPFLRSLINTSRRPPVVISVRLHGALESIKAGIPTIHLSYERKGFGAFEDLGLADYVHNCTDFSVERVAGQVAELRTDPNRYFERIQRKMSVNRQHYASLIERMRWAVRSTHQ